MDDAELEQAMRDGLERRAALADDTVSLADRARTDVRRRRGGRLVAGLVAASVAVVAVVAVVGVALDDDQRPDTSVGVTDEPDVPTGEPGRRTEYWADLAVDVPADWGWGSAPPVCGPGPSRTADGRRVVRFDEAVPYVGRPLAQTDMCVDPPSPPSAPYVWLGADVAPGTIDLGDGWVQESIEVNGSMLTVATDDAELREHILSTARGGEVCLSEVELRGTLDHDGGVNASREPTTLRVCVYRREDASDTTPELAYAAELGPVALAAYRRAMSEAAPPRDQCPTLGILEVEWVVLEQVADDGTVSDRDVVHTVCPGIDRDAGGLSGYETSPLTPAMTSPWAVGGIPAVVYGSSISVTGLADYFIGGLG